MTSLAVPAATNTRDDGPAHGTALALCAAAALLLFWPLVQGRVLSSGTPLLDPQYVGTGVGGLLYPGAWLRWMMPVDLAITVGMMVQVVMAGWLMYGCARALSLSWESAAIAGVAYELTGIVASQTRPGPDATMLVSALTPLAFWLVVLAIRHRRRWAFGAASLVVALFAAAHALTAYLVVVALGLWALYLSVWDSERPSDVPAWQPLSWTVGALMLGMAITAIPSMMAQASVPLPPQTVSGPVIGGRAVTGNALSWSQVFTLVLPEYNGAQGRSLGRSPAALAAYVGVLPLALAGLAFTDGSRRRLTTALAIAVLALLTTALGGSRLFDQPFSQSFFRPSCLTAFTICVLAGIGAEQVLGQRVRPSTTLFATACVMAFAMLGIVGGLQRVAVLMINPERLDVATQNAQALLSGALRLLGVSLVAGVSLWLVSSRRMPRRMAVLTLAVVTVLDLWSVDRRVLRWSSREVVTSSTSTTAAV